MNESHVYTLERRLWSETEPDCFVFSDLVAAKIAAHKEAVWVESLPGCWLGVAPQTAFIYRIVKQRVRNATP